MGEIAIDRIREVTNELANVVSRLKKLLPEGYVVRITAFEGLCSLDVGKAMHPEVLEALKKANLLPDYSVIENDVLFLSGKVDTLPLLVEKLEKLEEYGKKVLAIKMLISSYLGDNQIPPAYVEVLKNILHDIPPAIVEVVEEIIEKELGGGKDGSSGT